MYPFIIMENEISNQPNDHLFIQHIKDAVIITDSRFGVSAWNKAAENLFGYTDSEIRGHDIDFLIPATTSTSNTRSLSVKSKGFTQGVLVQVTKSKQKIHVHASLHVFEQNTSSTGFIITFRPFEQCILPGDPITKERSAGIPDTPLNKSEEKYRLLIEQAMDGIFICDQDGWFSYVNVRACEMSGYTGEELLLKNFIDLVPVHLRNGGDDPFYQLRSGPINYKDGQLLKKDGSILYVEICARFTADGEVVTISHDITERKKTELALQHSEERHHLLFQHIQNIRETERTNIAREIHDELGQQLTILKMDISWLQKKLKDHKDIAVPKKIEETINMLSETIKTVRRIATDLRPSMLDDLGLIAAMEWQSHEFEKRSGINISFQSGILQLPITTTAATSFFRIYQEALTNIGRHAKAKNVFCNLQLQNEQLILTIKDDGQGFDIRTLSSKKTLGLLGMKERALMMGGLFEIKSVPDEGTTIVVTASLNIQNADQTEQYK